MLENYVLFFCLFGIVRRFYQDTNYKPLNRYTKSIIGIIYESSDW